PTDGVFSVRQYGNRPRKDPGPAPLLFSNTMRADRRALYSIRRDTAVRAYPWHMPADARRGRPLPACNSCARPGTAATAKDCNWDFRDSDMVRFRPLPSRAPRMRADTEGPLSRLRSALRL